MNFVNRIAETVGTPGNCRRNFMAQIALQPASTRGLTAHMVAPRANKIELKFGSHQANLKTAVLTGDCGFFTSADLRQCPPLSGQGLGNIAKFSI